MEYTTEVLDRTTGDLKTISLGNWVSVTEYGVLKGVGSRQVRAILSHLGLLQEQLEVSKSGTSRVARRRLTDEAVKAGLGKRVYPKKAGTYPFDVLSPKGQEWIDQRWDDAVQTMAVETASSPMVKAAKECLDTFKASRRLEMTPQMEVCFLSDHFPDLLQVDMCRITGASPRMVSLHVNTRADQLRAWKAWRVAPLPATKQVTFNPDFIGTSR
ncbi:hypothetical protein [Mesorhizobium muleiense]|uniref:hypothetical protein n=1 Tax=Mesorhizobium muleiense TaxID=1004279 RepID=UPI001F304E83|nr:hypothetical protein [Mesorhizobium muleiense]MCF6114137.1 hypothetical protein [Mesorhizobium muleiense]